MAALQTLFSVLGVTNPLLRYGVLVSKFLRYGVLVTYLFLRYGVLTDWMQIDHKTVVSGLLYFLCNRVFNVKVQNFLLDVVAEIVYGHFFKTHFKLLHYCSRVVLSVYGLEDWTTDDALSVLFKGSAFRYQITSAIVAVIKIVYPTLVVVSITSIKSLIVFIMLLGVIPLLRLLNAVEIRGRLSNACCLRIMTAFIFCFFVCFA